MLIPNIHRVTELWKTLQILQEGIALIQDPVILFQICFIFGDDLTERRIQKLSSQSRSVLDQGQMDTDSSWISLRKAVF